MSTDPLEVDSLPSDPREMALRLLGMTVSELKGIDEKVVSGQKYVGGIKSDISKIVQDVTTNLSPKQTIISHQNVIPAIPVQQPTIEINSVADTAQKDTSSADLFTTQLQEDDKNQLEFDFYRKIKPEDLEYQLKKVNSVLEDLVFKVDAIYNILLKKSTKNVNGNHR